MTIKYYFGPCSKEYWINISNQENRNKINIYVPESIDWNFYTYISNIEIQI